MAPCLPGVFDTLVTFSGVLSCPCCALFGAVGRVAVNGLPPLQVGGSGRRGCFLVCLLLHTCSCFFGVVWSLVLVFWLVSWAYCSCFGFFVSVQLRMPVMACVCLRFGVPSGQGCLCVRLGFSRSVLLFLQLIDSEAGPLIVFEFELTLFLALCALDLFTLFG